MIAGQGFLVAVPDVYHEFTELGEAFAYDQAGTDRGNALKTTKELASYRRRCSGSESSFFRQDPGCNGRMGTMGICLGGHLAFRTAMNEEVETGICFYATDIHARKFGQGNVR